MKQLGKKDIIERVFGSYNIINEASMGDEESKFYDGKAWSKSQLSDVIEILKTFKSLYDEIDNDRGSVSDGTLGSLMALLTENATKLIDICNAIEGNVDSKDNPELYDQNNKNLDEINEPTQDVNSDTALDYEEA